MEDASRARRELGWFPTLSFPELVAIMVEAAQQRLRALQQRGKEV